MTFQELTEELARKQQELERCVQRTLPVKVGSGAKEHFRQNFRKGGFVDGGLHKWKPAKRIGKAKGASGQYGTLLSGRNHLYDSITYVPGNAEVHIQNKAPYAAVHNEGLKAGRGKGFTMPKRQFIGDSRELTEKVKDIIETELTKIINK